MRPPTIPTTIPVNRDDSKQVIIMKSLYNSLIEYREPKTQRILIQVFMCLPSRKDFPEYYNVIAKPMTMNKIRERIERQQYQDEDSCMEDFKLMFSNCKFFNEDDSLIYKDAENLESILYKKWDQLMDEHSRPMRDSKDATREAILNASTNINSATSNSSPAHKNDRVNNTSTNHGSSTNSDNKQIINDSSAVVTNNSNNIKNSATSSSTNHLRQDSIAANNSSATATTNAHTINGTSNNSNSNTNDHNTTPNHNTTPSLNTSKSNSNNLNSTSNNNGIHNPQKDTTISQQSDSTNHSTNEQQHNGCEESNSSSIRINHNYHNETSMDSTSNLSADLLASTPVEKCSLNTRRGRNSDAPKRQLLTGYIIYASEIRKQVIDKNPNQNFGDISRLVGNEWKALPPDVRSKYDQRALIHNKRVRERAQRDLQLSAEGRLSNGLHTPKLTKRKLAKLAKEQMRQHHLSIAGHGDDLSGQSPRLGHDPSSPMVSQTTNSSYKHPHNQHSQPQTTSTQATSSKLTTVESSTQTTVFRFVEPPTKKRLVYSETFRKYIEGLQVPNKDLLAEETTPERPPELPTQWLGAGKGRHESAEAALWALRDFMLQDAVTMRRSIEPYL